MFLRLGIRERLGPLALIGLFFGLGSLLVLASVAIGGGGGTAAVADVSAKPQIKKVTYGRYKDKGSKRSWRGLRVVAQDPDGQIIALTVEHNKQWSEHADGGCGLGGKRNGEREVWGLPQRLRPGLYKLRITAWSSSCDQENRAESVTVTKRLRVKRKKHKKSG